MNVANDIALCRACNQVHALSDLISDVALDPNVDLHRPPQGCWHRRDGMGEVVGASHRSLAMALPMLGVALFWNGIVSVFVVLAIASTLHLLDVDVPDWFPAPRMNGETMGVGMTIFLWIFLTPFIVIGISMVVGFLSAIFGKTEVRAESGRVCVATGIGPFRWNRRFEFSQLEKIRVEHKQSNKDDSESKQIVVELSGGRTVKFGSSLRDERRQFLASAANLIIRRQDGGILMRPHI